MASSEKSSQLKLEDAPLSILKVWLIKFNLKYTTHAKFDITAKQRLSWQENQYIGFNWEKNFNIFMQMKWYICLTKNYFLQQPIWPIFKISVTSGIMICSRKTLKVQNIERFSNTLTNPNTSPKAYWSMLFMNNEKISRIAPILHENKLIIDFSYSVKKIQLFLCHSVYTGRQ